MTGYTVPLITDVRQDASRSLPVAAGDVVMLEREAGDRQAIRVVSAGGHELGYLHRQSAKWIADRLDSGKFLEVRIAPLVSVDGHGGGGRVQLSVQTEPGLNDERPWWRRLFAS